VSPAVAGECRARKYFLKKCCDSPDMTADRKKMGSHMSFDIVSNLPIGTGGLSAGTSAAQDRRDLVDAVRAINRSGLLWPGRELMFRSDPASHQLVVEMLNTETQEVVDQIPSQEVLRMAAEASLSGPVP
jgi:hypothetical protein